MVTKTLAKPHSISETSPITGEELVEMGSIGPTELVKGELITMSPAGHPHGYYEGNFYAVLRVFVYHNKLGRVLVGEVGIYTGRNPDTVRGADVAFISNDRLSQVQSQSFLDVAPELIVEILSPDDRWSNVIEKLDEYFAVDVKMVWVADPRRQQVHVYHSPTEVERFGIDDELSGGDVLPGFSVSVAELFEE